MKRIVGAIVVGVLAFSGIYALAASLSVTSDSLGAGNVAVSACQSATLNVAYAPTYAAGISAYSTGTVTVSGLASTCFTVPYKVTLYGAAGASVGELTGTTPGSGTFTAAFSGLSAASVTGVAVVLGG
jgi:hypothetical protein